MNFSDLKVLVTDGAGRQTLTIIRGLREIGCNTTVLCSSRWDVCFVSRIPDKKILDSKAESSHEGYISFLLSILAEGKYDVLLPVAEVTTNKVTINEQEIGKFVKIACASRDVYIQAFNKQRTFEKAMEIGIPCPYTRRDGQSIEDFISHATFPIIVKPRQGMGSIGLHKYNTVREFTTSLNEHLFDSDEYVIQECVPFSTRIGTYIFVDQDNNITTSMAQEVLRWYPIDAGTAIITRSIDSPDAIRYSCELLKALGWKGFANVGFMIEKSTGKLKLLEINGRITAGIKLSLYCGINIAKQLIEMALNRKVTVYPDNRKFGLMSRHSQADITWFFQSPDRFRCKPSWFSWKNTTDLVFWRDDPLPYFAYTLKGVFQYKNFMRKRRR